MPQYSPRWSGLRTKQANGTGRKHSVVLSDKEYAQLMEDLAELEMIAEREDEPAEPLESVKERLAEKWGR